MQTSSVLNKLTAGEMATAERVAGLSIATLEDANFPKVPILGALAWVYAKRENPTLTYESFMDSNTLEQITELLGLEEEEGKAEGE